MVPCKQKTEAFPPERAMASADATAAQGGRALSRTKLGMWRVGGVLRPQLVRRGFLWWCAGLSCSCGRARQRAGTAGKGSSDNSDPQICHRKPPLSPAPRPSSIACSNTGTSRVAGLKLGFGGCGSAEGPPECTRSRNPRFFLCDIRVLLFFLILVFKTRQNIAWRAAEFSTCGELVMKRIKSS